MSDESGQSGVTGIKIEVLGKAPERLIEMVRAGAWSLFEPYQIRRLAKADVDAATIRATGERDIKRLQAKWDEEDREKPTADVLEGEIVEADVDLPSSSGAPRLVAHEDDDGEAEPIPLVQRAARHRELQAAQRQANVEAVFADAAAEVRGIPDEEVTDRPVDPTFATRFFEYAQEASDDRVRSMWAKVLADEVRHGDGSLRALEVLKTLSADEARKFDVLARCAAVDGVVATGDRHEVEGLSFSDLLTLSEAGLLSENFTLSTTFRVGEGPSDGTERFGIALVYPKHLVRVACVDEYHGNIQALRLTTAGRIIARALKLETNLDWVRKISDRIKARRSAVRVSIHEIWNRTGERFVVNPMPLYEAS